MNWDLTRIEEIALEDQNIIFREALMKLQLQANYGNCPAKLNKHLARSPCVNYSNESLLQCEAPQL